MPVRAATSFIAASFRTVWALELLLHLKRYSDRAWSGKDLVETLRGSELIVSQSLDGLVAAGLVSIDEQGCARYQPASADIATLADQTESLYARSPDAVRRTIVAGANAGLTAFADAFRLKGD